MMKRIFAFLGFFLPLFIVAAVHAQSPEELAAKYGITFPIFELGNCANYSDCRLYCEDPANHERCIQFAKNKGFYSQDTAIDAKKKDMLVYAQSELGCTTIASCRQFCSYEQNWQKCGEFAKKHHLSGGHASSQKEEILKLAQVELGCESYDACMAYCEKEENMERCMDFASRHNMGGENYPHEPPEVSCSKMSSECKWDGQSCICSGLQTCQQNPGCSWNGTYCNCGEGKYPSQEESGQVWCLRLPGCQWTGTQCDCTNKDYDQYCRDNPDKCPSGYSDTPARREPTLQLQQQGDPSLECAKYGCTFDGKTCQCPQSEQHTIDFSSQCLSKPGCSWDASSNICSCPTEEQPPSIPGPVQECESVAPGCYWDGIDCRCPQNQPTPSSQVHGAATTRGLLLQLLQFLVNRL